MYKESVCAETESQKAKAMEGNRWAIKQIYAVEKKMGEHSEKAAKCYLWSKATYSPPWEGDTTPAQNSVCTLQVFTAYMYACIAEVVFRKFNDITFQFRTTETINANEGN